MAVGLGAFFGCTLPRMLAIKRSKEVTYNRMSEQRPYQLLGGKLKQAREHLRESLAEVSGAVEIEAKTLQKIEQGNQRPDEEILLLLISHLQFKDDEATRLWELAGYSDGATFFEDSKTLNVTIPSDTRVFYTDMVHVMVNDHGIVINFLQNSGPGNQAIAVSRVGMSKEHAGSVLKILSQSLEQPAQPRIVRALPAPKSKKNPPKTKS